MKTKKPKKEVNNSSAFSQLIKQVEKEKKRARIMYSVALVVLVSSLFTFLLFSPFEVPAFSRLGDRILGREEKQEEEKKAVKEETEEVEEDTKEVVEEEELVTEPSTIIHPPTIPAPATTPSPSTAITPEPPISTKVEKTYSCSSYEMEDYGRGYCIALARFEGWEATYNSGIAHCENEALSFGIAGTEEYNQAYQECLNPIQGLLDHYYEEAEKEYDTARYYIQMLRNCGDEGEILGSYYSDSNCHYYGTGWVNW